MSQPELGAATDEQEGEEEVNALEGRSFQDLGPTPFLLVLSSSAVRVLLCLFRSLGKPQPRNNENETHATNIT